MKALKIAGKILLWTIVSLVALVLIVFGLLQTELGRGWVKDIVLSVLNDTFKGSIEVERIGGFLPFDAELEGVVIKDPEGDVALSVALVTADFHPLELLDSRVHLSNIQVVDPVVNIFDDQQQMMLARAFEPREPSLDDTPSPWIIELEGIDLNRGLVSGVIPGEDFSLSEITLDLTLGVGPKGPTWRGVTLRAIPIGGSDLALAMNGGPLLVTSSGALDGDLLRIDRLDVNAGPHAISATGAIDLVSMNGDVRLIGLHVDLDALPAPVRGALMGLEGLIEGSGEASIDEGEATIRLALSTPVGHLSLQGGAVVLPALGSFAANIWIFDSVLPRGLQDELPREARAMRVDTTIEVHGRGDPIGPEGDLGVDMEIWQRGLDDLGHLAVTFARDHSETGVEIPPTFNFSVHGESFRLQPWLGIVGQRDLSGELFGVWAEGTLGIPMNDEPLQIAGMYAIEGGVSGIVTPAPDEGILLSVPLFSTLGSISWDGLNAPAGHAELTASDVVAENASVGLVVASVDVLGDGEGHVRLDGMLRAVNASRFDVHADSVEVPFDVVLTSPLPTGDVGFRVFGVSNVDHAVDRAEGDLHLVREGMGVRLYGDVSLGGAKLMGGEHRIGGGQLHLDYHLTALDPLDPLVVPSRGSVVGSFSRVSSGGRSAREVAIDLRVVAANGFGGPLAVSGTTKVEGVVTPEADVETGVVWVDVVVDGERISGQADVAAGSALVKAIPPEGGRRFDELHFDVRARPGNKLELDGTLTETGKLETSVKAVVGLPLAGRKLTAEVQELRATRPTQAGGRSASVELVRIEGARLDASGRIQLGKVVLGSGAERAGLTLEGTIDPGRGTLDLKGHAKDMRLDEWVANFVLLTGLPIEGLPDADGVLGFDLAASGTLAEPRLTLTMRVREARLGKSDHGALDVDLTLEAKRFRGTYGVKWSEDGRLDGTLDLPVDVSFDPVRVRFDRAAPLTISMKAKVPDVRDALAWAESATGGPVLADVEGQTDLQLDVTGTGLVPKVVFRATPLELNKWRGSIHVDAGADPMIPARWHGTAIINEEKAQASKQPEKDELGELIRFDIDLPTATFEAIWRGDPDGVQEVLQTDRIGFSALVPEHALGSFPGVDMIEDFAYADVRVMLDVKVQGTYPHLTASGDIRVTELQALGFAGGGHVRLDTIDDRLLLQLVASGRDEGLVTGQISIPKFGTLLGDPGSFGELLSNADFKADLHTASLPTERLIDLDPDIGQLVEQLFPYSTATVHLVARGHADGPEATLVVSVVQDAPSEPESSTPGKPTSSYQLGGSTTLAEQTYLVVQLRPDHTEVNAMLLPNSKIGAGLSLTARAELGTTKLLAGTLGNIDATPISGQLYADQFALDGLMSTLQETLGGTRGFLMGSLAISGTIGAPVLDGWPELHLEPLSVPMIGFEEPVHLLIAFEGNDIRLEPVVFENTTKAEPERMELNFEARVASLDPKDITLDGSLVLERYQALSTSDMKARASGKITVSGTAARPVIAGNINIIDGVIAPNIAQREVRAMGLPADVHLVRGDPKPPTTRAKRVVSRKTSLIIDIGVEIPRDAVRVEPHIVQPFGEVRALLWPYGKVEIRTVARELGIFGTVYVPKENIYLYGKKFTVDPDSRLVFTGDMQTDPQLFFTARYNIEHIDLTPIGLQTATDSEVVVRVTGSPTTRLRIDFGSNPPMDEANILSVIALDQPAGGGDGLGEAVTTQIAGAVLGMATLELTRDLVDKLPIDVLRVEAAGSTIEQARVTLGKRIAKDVFFYTYFNVNAQDDESVYEFSGEYRINKIFSILGKWGDIGELSLEGSLRFQP